MFLPASLVRPLLIVFVVGAVGGGLLACGNEGAATDVEVVNPRLVKMPSGQRAFTGTLVNEQPRALSIVQIEVRLYDNAGSPVETVRMDINDIPAQDSVDFSEKVDSDRPFSQAQIQTILTP